MNSNSEYGNRPLQNPRVEDFAKPESNLSKPALDFDPMDLSSFGEVAHRTTAKGQLKMKVGTPLQRVQSWYNHILSNLRRREEQLELITYWQEFAPAFAIVTSVLLVFGTGAAALTFFNKIQPKIPFYYNAFTGYWEQVDKSTLLLLPVLFLVSLPIVIRFTYEIHRIDPRLSKTINMIIGIINALFIIAFVQLYTLILPS